ncbi:hypothetical protein [Ferrovum sp.]|uniref:hypothetical protein n=1 Tax=Ferrovum sp. TaxID=2609467 RepID=UPI00260E1B54|nr:hypothetical protein [Ferrovum sp.]
MILDNKPNKPDFWKEITLWRFNKITGFWSPVRVCKQATAKEWLEIFRRDEPNEIFVLSLFKPKKAPESENACAHIRLQ